MGNQTPEGEWGFSIENSHNLGQGPNHGVLKNSSQSGNLDALGSTGRRKKEARPMVRKKIGHLGSSRPCRHPTLPSL